MKASPDINDIHTGQGDDAARQHSDKAKHFKADAKSGANQKDKTKKSFTLVRFDEIRLSTSPNALVKGIVPREGIIVIWGPPKCGKSFLTFDMFLHVALGWPYRERRVQQGAVVYLALEGGGGFAARVEAWRRQHLNGHKGDVPFYLLTVPVDLVADHKKLIEAIEAQVKSPAAVVIDTLNRSLNGSENDPKDMGHYIRAADAIREEFNCVVAIVHHCGINEQRPRGHTSLAGANDAQVAVVRDEDTGIIKATVEHMKDGEAGAVIHSRLQPIDLGNDDDGDPISSCVILPADAGNSSADKFRAKGNTGIAIDALERALADVGQTPPASNHIPQGPDIRVCPVEDFRRYFYQLKTGSPDTKQKAFVRAVESLQTGRIIGVWNDLVWLTGHAGRGRT